MANIDNIYLIVAFMQKKKEKKTTRSPPFIIGSITSHATKKSLL